MADGKVTRRSVLGASAPPTIAESRLSAGAVMAHGTRMSVVVIDDLTRLPRMLEIDGEAFRAGFNRAPFLIKHHLADHPLFSLRRLVELASRLPEEKVKYNGADISVATGLYEGPRTGLSVQETIRRIEECRSWMVSRHFTWTPNIISCFRFAAKNG